jgi:hypothetical protein
MSGSRRIHANACVLVAFFGRHEVRFDAEKAFPKAFVKGFAKSAGGTFLGRDLATGREHEDPPGNRRPFGKALERSARPRRKAFSMISVERSPGYPLGRGR